MPLTLRIPLKFLEVERFLLSSRCLSHRQFLTVICDGSRAISRIALPGGRMLEGGAKWYGQGARIAGLRYH